MENEKQLIVLCREMIERSLNWGDSAAWSNQDFETLSDRIHEKTQVRLSISTLKRIWGKVRYDNSPTRATLDVLAKFSGYEGWRDFESKHRPRQRDPEIESVIPPPVYNSRRRFLRIATSTGAALACLIVVFLLIKGKTPAPEANAIVFKAQKVSDDLPNSVVFTYDATPFNVDSVIIQQSWDPQRREQVSGKGHKHTSVYYTPGYFIAKLIVNDEIKKEDVVFIKTQGWKGIITAKPPIYLNAEETKLPGSIGLTSDMMRQKTGASVFTDRGVTFTNVREFDSLQGDAFTLDMRLKNTSTVEESLCRKVVITVLTKGGAIIIPLSAKGCIAELDLLAPDGWISGKENDLSAFGCAFTDFEHVVCEVKDQHLRIMLNDKLIFDKVQQYTVGEIIGLRIYFDGVGEITDVRLSSREKVVYEETFQ